MKITERAVAEKIRDYLAHIITLAELVDWAENVTMEGGFETEDPRKLSHIVGRLGVTDEREFQPTWEVQADLVKK